MRKGCIATIAALGLLLLGLAYGVYRYVSSITGLPDDLKPYEDPLEAAALIRSKEPPPAGGARLTTEHLKIYLDGLDSVSAGLPPVTRALDSLIRVSDDAADTTISLANAPNVLRHIALFGPRTHAAIVRYLNTHGLSLAQYLWIRDRIIAASDITIREARARSATVAREGVSLPFSDDLREELFVQIDSLRRLGMIDSSERAAVAPYRDDILHRGTLSLLNVEATLTRERQGRMRIGVD